MKTNVFGRLLVPVLLVLSLLAGCASTPKEPAVDQGSAQAEQAIAAAEAAIAKANANDWIWRDTEKFLQQAQDAAAKGDSEAAVSLANKARNQAELAENQYYLEQAKAMFKEASAVQGLNASQQNALSEADKAIRNAEGRKAYDLLTPLLAEIRAASMQYEVVSGDSLWAISGKPETYNNPYQWPLIFKANRDQIKDADLIHPGQTFDVDRNPSASDLESAVNHARNRGAWSIGVREDSDRRFLGGSLRLQ
ncbi:MAG: LysM peptidoglycan-binding domain-containing protein [Thiogranum sp.]